MFAVNEESKKKIYKTFNRTETMVTEDVEIIKKWMKTQYHLPDVMDEAQIKNFLHLNKFSIEKTEKKINMYYTIRSLMPEFYVTCNPKLKKMQQMLHKIIRLFEDFMYNDVLIFDVENVGFDDMTKMTPSLINKVTLYKEVYSFRLKNMYFLNAPSFVSPLLFVIKSVVKPKIFDRVQVCSGTKILNDLFSEEELPKDYSGNGLSLQELSDKMAAKLAQYQERFDVLDELRVDESLRPEKLNNDEILGFHGNFRKLGVD